MGTGIWLLISVAPALGRPSLEARLAPYVRAVSPGAREFLDRVSPTPLPVFGLYVSSLTAVALPVLFAIFGAPASTTQRLGQAKSSLDAQQFRSIQFVVFLGGCAVGLVAAAVLGLSGAAVAWQLAAIVTSAVAPPVVWERLLQRRAKRRLDRIASELPTVLEFLTLSLSAGEGIVDAIRRVSVVSSGELAGEFARACAVVSSGISVSDALSRAASELDFPPFTRLVEQIDGALERGTPLAEVFRSQAHDARDQSKRELLEAAGKKEVAMLFPLVFLILPTTIAFAIFPGIVVLQTGF